MSLTITEARVLNLWDSGNPARQIARTTGLTIARVSKVIETYHDRGTRQHNSKMKIGSAALRDAILAETRPSAARSKSLIWNTRSLAEVASQQGAAA